MIGVKPGRQITGHVKLGIGSGKHRGFERKFGSPPRNLIKKKSRARFVKITGYERVDFLSSGCLPFLRKKSFAPESVIATTKCGWRFRRDACIAMHVLVLGMLLAHIDPHTGIDLFGGETTEPRPDTISGPGGLLCFPDSIPSFT